jgi:tol-pal system protein YbgF
MLSCLPLAGCLASKGDIRLLQDELRVSRQQQAEGDTSVLRANQQVRTQIAQLSATLDRAIDSLRAVSQRLAAFQANTNGELDAMGRQMVQFQALLGQTTRNVQDTRQQLEALREQANASGAPVGPPPGGADTSRAAPGMPGAATMFTSAMEQLNQGNYRTARNSLDQLLATYPTFDRAPQAQLRVGDAYMAEGNTAAADSVYQIVYNKYPRAREAATGLYKHGKILWDANKKAEARIVLNRVVREFADSDEAQLAKDLLNGR